MKKIDSQEDIKSNGIYITFEESNKTPVFIDYKNEYWIRLDINKKIEYTKENVYPDMRASVRESLESYSEVYEVSDNEMNNILMMWELNKWVR